MDQIDGDCWSSDSDGFGFTEKRQKTSDATTEAVDDEQKLVQIQKDQVHVLANLLNKLEFGGNENVLNMIDVVKLAQLTVKYFFFSLNEKSEWHIVVVPEMFHIGFMLLLSLHFQILLFVQRLRIWHSQCFRDSVPFGNRLERLRCVNYWKVHCSSMDTCSKRTTTKIVRRKAVGKMVAVAICCC